MDTYEKFINNILETRGRFACGEEYCERHHILPKCMGGTDDNENLIDLYAREHFEAHKLLAQENPNNHKLVYAWHCMSVMYSDNQERYELTPEEYEEARVVFSKTISENFLGSGNPFYGKHHSDDVCEALSAKLSGENNPMYGKHLSDETRNKLSESAKDRFKDVNNHPMYGKRHSDSSKRKMSESHKNISEETRQKMRDAWKTRIPATEETREKIRVATSGKNNPRAQAVYCIELDEYFWGATEAAEKYNICKSSISQCCKGKLRHAGKHPVTGEKLHWEIVAKNELENNI
jgi:hypothetical protein